MHNELGILLARQDKLDLAAARFEQALALQPDLPQTHYNLGKVLLNQGKLDEAADRLRQSLALRPDFVEAHYNLGGTLLKQGKIGQAAAQFQRALALRPDYADAQMHLATCYLVEGDYQRGWPEYEARLRIPKYLSWRHDVPRWRGEPLTGRRVLLLGEPGLGNTILFLRYARLLKERGARVVLAAHSALGRLLASHPDLDELFVPGSAEELPPADFHLPLLSAPYAFGTDGSNIPGDVPYLWADAELTGAWRRELAGVDGYRIGIVWQGSPAYRQDRWRSTALAQFAPLAALPGVRLVSLQKGIGSEQIATVDFPVLDLSARLDETDGPFMDTAAVIRNLDLVVSVDTAVAHLAGALGAPVWVALPWSPYWPWLLDRGDSPWYPSARLFRQTTLGGWPDVFERMAQAVGRLAAVNPARGD